MVHAEVALITAEGAGPGDVGLFANNEQHRRDIEGVKVTNDPNLPTSAALHFMATRWRAKHALACHSAKKK